MTVFTVLPMSLSRTDLLQIDLNQAVELSDYRLEPNAYAQFDFNNTDDRVLQSVNSNKSLNLVTASTNTNRPIYNEDYMSFNSGRGTFLQTDLIDNSSLSGFTLSAVVRIPAVVLPTPITAIFGLWSKASLGAMLYFRNNKLNLAASAGLTHRELTNPVFDSWMHLTLSVDNVAKRVSALIVANQQVLEFSYALTSREYADVALILGNAAIAGSTYLNADYSEFIIFDRALSSIDTTQLYRRAKKRSADKGIVI